MYVYIYIYIYIYVNCTESLFLLNQYKGQVLVLFSKIWLDLTILRGTRLDQGIIINIYKAECVWILGSLITQMH